MKYNRNLSRKRMIKYGPSKSGRALARALNVKTLYNLIHTKFVARAGDAVLNWGSSQGVRAKIGVTPRYINKPQAVAVAVSKMAAFRKMAEGGVNVPEFTTDRNVATGWVREGRSVLARSLDRASSGRGIVYIEGDKNYQGLVPSARFYVKYRPKKHEFRVHVVNGQVIDVQQKKVRRGFENPNYQIRNFDKGWVFCRDGVSCPGMVSEQAIRATTALGLDFGAVDIGWNEKNQEATVYEVNTAPGLVNTTLTNYARALRNLL